VLEHPEKYEFANAGQFLVLDIGQQQNRPRTMIADERTMTILVGTQPDYGQYGGALTYYHPTSGEAYTVRNLIPQHTIQSLAFDESDPHVAYVGTSVYGGTGTDPLGEDAHLVKWDIASQRILFDRIPEKDNAQIISVVSAQQRVYVLTKNQNLLLIHRSTGEVIKAHTGTRLLKIIRSVDGNVYGIDRTTFFKIDKDTLASEALMEGFGMLNDLKEDKASRAFYVLDGFILWRVQTQPAASSSLSAKTTSSGEIVLTWTAKSDSTSGFKIERKLGDCGSPNPWMLITTKSPGTIYHTDTGLMADAGYAYRVRAYSAECDSAYSNCTSSKTSAPETPRAPTNLKASAVSTNRVILTWRDNSANETSFEVYRKAGTGSSTLISSTPAGTVSFEDISATGNRDTTSYSYYVRAHNAKGYSAATTVATVPYAPTMLSATPGAPGQINVLWTDKSDNDAGFLIYRKTGKCNDPGAWNSQAMNPANDVTYTDTALVSGTTYSYRVRTYTRSAALPYSYAYSLLSSCAEMTAP
jgi:hypothetical protein